MSSGIGSPTIEFGVVPTGTYIDVEYDLADVKNVFIDIDS